MPQVIKIKLSELALDQRDVVSLYNPFMRLPTSNYILVAASLCAASCTFSQTLPMKWEEMTAAEFQQGLQKAQGTCILPFGIIEKHGPHLPLGNDLINVRYAVQHGVQQEYAIVFPEYYFGQIFEAKHEPGTIAYSAKLQLELLQETTDEMARNGCKKVLIVNGPGGNNYLLPYSRNHSLPHRTITLCMFSRTARIRQDVQR